MKHVKLFEQFIDEKVQYDYGIMNGKKITSTWAGSTDNEKDFIKMIENMPETLERVNVQSSMSLFNPDDEEFKGPINSSTKKKIIKIVKDMTKAYKEAGNPIQTYRLNSYYMVAGNNHDSNPAYIKFETKKSRQFGKDMSTDKGLD